MGNSLDTDGTSRAPAEDANQSTNSLNITFLSLESKVRPILQIQPFLNLFYDLSSLRI